MSSTAGTTKYVVKEMRKEGKKVGLLKVRLYRPFPKEEIASLLDGRKAVAVLDRAYSIGAEAPLFCEIKSALYDAKVKPQLASYVYGLGGRDTPPSLIRSVFEDLISGNISKEEKYLGVRE